ncbi:MAG: hypothetical protein HND57_08445 [Planctomycetes bacterium]|nr:hypothetical protein [Planctomycetota bacterium]
MDRARFNIVITSLVLLSTSLCLPLDGPAQSLTMLPTRVAGPLAATAEAEDEFDQAVRLMGRVAVATSGGEHHYFIRGLRQLKDPALATLFGALAQSENRTIRINGLLGLAEVTDPPRLDMTRVSRIDAIRDRAEVMYEAMQLDLAEANELRQVLEWSDVDETTLISTMTVLVHLGNNIPIERTRELMEHSDSAGVRVWATLLLSHLNEVTMPASDIVAILDELPPSLKRRTVTTILGALYQYPFSGAAPWCAELLNLEPGWPGAKFQIIATLLKLDPMAGVKVWEQAYAEAGGLSDQLRLILVRLDAAPTIGSPQDWQAAADSDTELVAALGQLGQALTGRASVPQAAVRLIGLHHIPSTQWLFQYASDEDTTADVATPILAAMIEDTLEDGNSLNERLEIAWRAADVLLGLDSDRVVQIRQRATKQQRRLTEEAILLGSLWTVNPEALALIEEVDQWPSTRAGSLALLLEARYADQLDADDLSRLSLVFRGAGSVSPGYEIQAAWLYIKHTGREREAMALILSDIASHRAGRANPPKP